jgi:hypothetical protein
MRGTCGATTDVLIVTPSPTPLLSHSLSPSFVYLTDPLWNVPEKVEKAEKAESGKEVLLKPLLR